MSNNARVHGGHGSRFEVLANSANPAFANMPKGTLPMRYASRRCNGYRPEDVWVRDTRRGQLMDIHQPKISLAQQFYTPENRKVIVESVVASLNKNDNGGNVVDASQIPSTVVTESLNRSYEIFGHTPENAPAARVGPSESLPWLAPPQKYQDDYHENLAECHENDLYRLNSFAARRLKEQIISERMLLSRFHRDLGGAIHVLDYPQLPPVSQSRHHELMSPYYNDISSQPGDGRASMLGGPAYGPKR